MIPFKVIFARKLDLDIKPDQIDYFIDLAKDILSEKGADHLHKEGNCLTFKNDILRLTSNWNLMAYTDAGFFEIKKVSNDKTQINYGVTFISLWIISTLFSICVFIGTKSIYSFLIAFCVLGILTWLVSIFRQRKLLITITDKIIEKKNDDKINAL